MRGACLGLNANFARIYRTAMPYEEVYIQRLRDDTDEQAEES